MRGKLADRAGLVVLRNYFSRIQIADAGGDGDRDAYAPGAWWDRTFSNGATGTINWVTDFGLPEIPKAVFVRLTVRDSASAGGGYYFALKAKSTTNQFAVDGQTERAVNDGYRTNHGMVPVADNGTSYYGVAASGVNTLDIRLIVTGWVK